MSGAIITGPFVWHHLITFNGYIQTSTEFPIENGTNGQSRENDLSTSAVLDQKFIEAAKYLVDKCNVAVLRYCCNGLDTQSVSAADQTATDTGKRSQTNRLIRRKLFILVSRTIRHS